jgi:nitrite reductase/ring-hydroxylating ferredoxin subunit
LTAANATLPPARRSRPREEIFAPVGAVTRFHDEDEAVAIANDSEYELSASVFTRDLRRAHTVSARLQAGVAGSTLGARSTGGHRSAASSGSGPGGRVAGTAGTSSPNPGISSWASTDFNSADEGTTVDTAEKQRFDVGPTGSVPEGGRLVVDAGGTVVGIFRVDGRLHAYENVCAHQGGPVCQGKMLPRIHEQLAVDQTSEGLYFDRSDPHIICPWHGYEYSITTGRHAGDPTISLVAIPVTDSDGRVYIDV